MVYHALVKSRLQYGIILWGSANKTALDKLNKLHNKAIRTVTGLPNNTPINELYYKANLLKIMDLYKLDLAKYMFKQQSKMNHTHNIPENLMLVNTVHKHNTRHSKTKIFINILGSITALTYYLHIYIYYLNVFGLH